MSGLTTQANELANQALMDEASRMLLSILGSVNPDRIDPKKYWDHAQKALQVGAERGTTFERMVSEMHSQLPIDGAFTMKTAKELYSIGSTLAAQRTYDAFRNVCRLNAPYIVVQARIWKQERRMNTEDYWIEETQPTQENT